MIFDFGVAMFVPSYAVGTWWLILRAWPGGLPSLVRLVGWRCDAVLSQIAYFRLSGRNLCKPGLWRSFFMRVAVVDIGIVLVRVAQRPVLVGVRVRLRAVPVEVVLVLVVLVVAVRMRVELRLVFVLVAVAFGQVQPDARAHQGGRAPEWPAGMLAQHRQGQRRADEGRGRKIGA